MARTGRNDPCPCGSGRKYKRCCVELERLAPVIEEIVSLPRLFPTLRPRGTTFDAWADLVAAGVLEDATVEDGIGRVAVKERRRIERAHAEEFPAVWRSFCDDLGDEKLVERTLVAGAVLAAIDERRPLDAQIVELLEEQAGHADPADVLALALDFGDLWNVHESIEADEAVSAIPAELDDDAHEPLWDAEVAAHANRLETEWHRQRLALLVRRLRAQLPLEGAPVASVTLANACDAFERDLTVGRRLAALLLADSLGRLRVELLRAA